MHEPAAWTLVATLACLVLQPTSAFAQTPPVAQTDAQDSWLGRVDLFAGLEGSKQPQDLGINASMGPRFSANIGAPVVRRVGFGMQAGVAINASDAAVHVLDQIDGTSRRTQVFATLGIFQRSDSFSWAFGYDALRQFYYDDVTLGQWRGEISAAAGESDQIGVWFTAASRGERASIGETALRLDPISQVSAMFRHVWPSGARTAVWAGIAEGHYNIVLLFPGNSRDRRSLVYGADIYMPLNEWLAITGATNLMTPTATGTVDAFMGITLTLGGGRRPKAPFVPMLGVANNTSFAVDLSRR